MSETPSAERDARRADALEGKQVKCATYSDVWCVCRGALYPGSLDTCVRRRNHVRDLKTKTKTKS